jgi:membrane dipeptidase
MWPALLLMISSLQAVRIQADMHLDTPTQFHRKGLSLDSPEGMEAGLDQLKAGGTNLAVEVLWPPRNVDPRAHIYGLMERLKIEEERIEDVVLVKTPQRAMREIEAGRIGLMLAIEGAHGLGKQNWEATLEDLHRQGLTVLGLAWSFSNQFAGSSGDGGGGLTAAGRRLLKHCQQLGILIDVSHASKESTMQACQNSPVPVIASHSNATAVHPHARNLTDEEIQCIAESGGVIGLNFHRPFLGGEANIEQIVAHANHIARVAGHGAVALGSDFDGLIQPAHGLTTSADLPALWRALRKSGWTRAQLDGIRGENFFRAWKTVYDHAHASD